MSNKEIKLDGEDVKSRKPRRKKAAPASSSSRKTTNKTASSKSGAKVQDAKGTKAGSKSVDEKLPEKLEIKVQEGVGETVKRVADKLGLGKLAKLFTDVTGEDCGCEDRREKYNKKRVLWRKKTVNCLTGEQYKELVEVALNWGENNPNRRMTREQSYSIAKLYSEIFGTRYELWCTACATTWAMKVRELEAVRDVYLESLEKIKN